MENLIKEELERERLEEIYYQDYKCYLDYMQKDYYLDFFYDEELKKYYIDDHIIEKKEPIYAPEIYKSFAEIDLDVLVHVIKGVYTDEKIEFLSQLRYLNKKYGIDYEFSWRRNYNDFALVVMDILKNEAHQRKCFNIYTHKEEYKILEKIDGLAIMLSFVEEYKGTYYLRSSAHYFLCPIHRENTPSFALFFNRAQASYRCYGCEASGHAYDYVKEFEDIDYKTFLATMNEAFEVGINKETVKPDLELVEKIKATIESETYQKIKANILAKLYGKHRV